MLGHLNLWRIVGMGNTMMDTRLKLLSCSSLCSLHTCPRKYQLTKVYPEATRDSTVHTAFGKAFGEGIQALLSGATIEDAVLRAVLQWDMDLEDELKDKSIWTCISALQSFAIVKHTTVLEEYEVATLVDGRLACELSFCIKLPDGFYYRGYVDVVLRHKITGSYLVVDVKTSGANYSAPDKYRNSPQAVGYSIVLDYIQPDLSQYDVMYYEYLTSTKKYVAHTFVVGNLQRAMWLRNLQLDIEIMKLYNQYPDWPMHGESCMSYSRACQFIEVCQMSTAALTGGKVIEEDGLSWEAEKGINYDIVVSFEDLIAGQLDRLS
jgi:hypothetical protein